MTRSRPEKSSRAAKSSPQASACAIIAPAAAAVISRFPSITRPRGTITTQSAGTSPTVKP